MPKPILGIDFDNTIVCYDEVFYSVALEKSLISKSISKSKESVKKYFIDNEQEHLWTELQGYVYGMRMNEASVYPGAIEFISKVIRKGWDVCIISHKTLYPYAGPKYDLHKAAKAWLNDKGFYNRESMGLNPESVFFEASISEKLNKIRQMKCNHFIDDLPELLQNKDFPAEVNKILFHPKQNTWKDISNYLLGAKHECC